MLRFANGVLILFGTLTTVPALSVECDSLRQARQVVEIASASGLTKSLYEQGLQLVRTQSPDKFSVKVVFAVTPENSKGVMFDNRRMRGSREQRAESSQAPSDLELSIDRTVINPNAFKIVIKQDQFRRTYEISIPFEAIAKAQAEGSKTLELETTTMYGPLSQVPIRAQVLVMLSGEGTLPISEIHLKSADPAIEPMEDTLEVRLTTPHFVRLTEN